jgi:O-antigen ligase
MIRRAMLIVLAMGLLVIPTIFVSGGADVYRLPKELVFRAEAIVLLALLVAVWRPRRRAELWVAGAIVGWSIVVTATSTNRVLSVDSLITIVAAAVIFLATCHAAESLAFEAVDVVMIGCCANAAVVILQELNVWQPVPGAEGHYGSVGLLGNANDVGTFLIAPAVAAMVMVITAAGRRRWVYLAISVLLVAGIAASATRTALLAFLASLFVLALIQLRLQARRAMLAIGAVLVVVGVVVLSPATTIGRGVRELADAARKGDSQRLLSERLLPFLAAVEMVRDHPIAGVGPGCFKYHYMPYRLALATKYPANWMRGYPMNWAEVHNDHLQVAAEAGIVGYLLFLAAIALLVRRPAADGLPTPRREFARALRWPLATAIFVVCLAQFPLELAAPRLMLLTFGALCITWDRNDATS